MNWHALSVLLYDQLLRNKIFFILKNYNANLLIEDQTSWIS